MTSPVPGFKITTAYAKRGRHWSCNANSQGGLHTGVDYAAPRGTPVVAARPGVVKHTSYGSAFGSKQFAIICADGSEDFYAHTISRPTNGKRVVLNERVASVGAEGNVTGPHLHFERHKRAGSWSCSNHTNPQPSIDFDNQQGEVPLNGDVYLSKLKFGQKDSDSVKRLQEALNRHKLTGGSTLPVTGTYGEMTDAEVRKCQKQHGYGSDAAGKSNVGPKQADHLFAGTGANVIDDVTVAPPDPPKPPDPPIVVPPEVLMKLVDYKYGGKPSGTQTAGTAFVAIQNGSYTPPGAGFLLSMVYVNAKYKLKAGATGADIRLRAVRAPHKGQPVDNTGYQDFAVPKATTNGDEFLITHLWFESCDAGRKVHWELDRSADMSSCVLGTRYTKWFWISWELFKVVESLFKATGRSAEEIPELIARTFAEEVFPEDPDAGTEPALPMTEELP